jgi:hypothetical protein
MVEGFVSGLPLRRGENLDTKLSCQDVSREREGVAREEG